MLGGNEIVEHILNYLLRGAVQRIAAALGLVRGAPYYMG